MGSTELREESGKAQDKSATAHPSLPQFMITNEKEVLYAQIIRRQPGCFVRRIWAHEISVFVPRLRDIAHPCSGSAQDLTRICSGCAEAC